MINGQPAIPVTEGGTIVYVATTSMPFPLRATPRRVASGMLDFLDYNKPVRLTAPPNPLDVSKLTKGSFGLSG